MTDRVVKLEAHIERPDKANFDGLTALACVTSASAQAALRAAFNDIDGVDCLFDASGSTPAAAIAGAAKSPDVVFFEFAGDQEATDKIRALRAAPDGARAHLVALIPAPTKAGTVRLLLEGADDVLSTAPDGIDITRSLARANLRTRESADDDRNRAPRILVFIHAAGGAGATTFAVNTAVQLKRRLTAAEGGVCLVDLDLQFGDAHLHLDVSLHSRLIDIVNAPERLDHRMLEDLMIDGPNGVRMLTAPDRPMPLDVLSPQIIDTILLLARRNYRYVVVDMPLALAHWTEAVLRRADHIFLVTQVNVTALRASRRLLDAIREERATTAPITIIANRYGGKSAVPKIPLSQASRALGAPIIITAPSDYALLVESLDQGVPASVLRPSSKFSAAVSTALDGVVEHKAEIAASSGGLAMSLFKSRR